MSIRSRVKAGRNPSGCFRRHLQRQRTLKLAKENRRKNKVAQDKRRQELRKSAVNHTLTLKAAVKAVGVIASLVVNGGSDVKSVPKQKAAKPKGGTRTKRTSGEVAVSA